MVKPARTFAEFLRRWLDDNDLTQRQFAAELPGVTESRVSRWVNGRDTPQLRYWADLSRTLGVERDDLQRLCYRDRKKMALADLRGIEQAVARIRGMIDPD